MADAAASGDYDLPRREGSDHFTPIDGVTATVMTRLDSVRRGPDGALVTAMDPWFLSEAEMAGRRQVLCVDDGHLLRPSATARGATT